DPATLGFQVRVLLGLEIAPGKSADVAKDLLRSKNVQTLSATTGRYDILVYALFHDNQELLNWITDELGSTRGVISVEEMTILKAVKTLYGYLRGERGVQEDIMPQSLDESALRLIKELELNPTESIADLGKKTGMNRWMTARKLRTLLDEKVLKVVTIVDPRALGLGVCAFILAKAQLDRIIPVAQTIAADKRVTQVSIVTGRFNILVYAAFPDMEDLYRFLTDDLGHIPGVNDHETMMQVGRPHAFHHLMG
ncbi:MAG: Lrp/AsnC ligand binding domain-containing protein, partial [Dehalococcoidia bacterium]